MAGEEEYSYKNKSDRLYFSYCKVLFGSCLAKENQIKKEDRERRKIQGLSDNCFITQLRFNSRLGKK